MSKQPTFLSVTSPLPEVFLGKDIHSNTGSGATIVKALDIAFTYCRTLGAQLATFDQLATASMNGADWTTGGFLLDRQELYYPCQTNSSFVCSTTNQPATVSGRAVCYGVKPVTGGYSNFKNAATTRYSQWSEFSGTTGYPEIFLVTTGNDIATQATASGVCTSLGSNRRLATLGELQTAQRSGLHFCTPGWTSSDASNVYNAISYYQAADCQNNGVHQHRNIPYNDALGWFDASDPLLGDYIASGMIPSKFANTAGFKVTNGATIIQSGSTGTGLPVLSFSATETFSMLPVTGSPKSWSMAFVARQTGTNKRIFEGLNPANNNGKGGGNYNFGYDEGKKQRFFIDKEHVSPSITSTATWDVVLINYNSSASGTTPLSITWNGTALSISQPGKDKPFWPLGINMGPTAYNGSCELAELIVYKRALTSDEQIRIIDYLNDKWITKPDRKFIDNVVGESFASPANPRGAICFGSKPFPTSESNAAYPLTGSFNLYQTINSPSTITAFNRDVFSQKYAVVNYTQPGTSTTPLSNSIFQQQCTYVSTLGSITGSGFFLCETDKAAKYADKDTNVGPYDQVCVFMGDRKNVSYSCKDRDKFSQNPDMIRYQSADDFNTFCQATARLYIDLSGVYFLESDQQSTIVNSVSTISSMQRVLEATSTTKCMTGTTNANCTNITIVLGQISSSLSTLTSKISVLNGISTISTLKGTVWSRRDDFQCYNFGV